MSENPESQTHSQQAGLTSGGTHPERPPNPATPANRPQEYDPNPTPRVARLAAVHLWAMDHVELDKLFPNMAHETRGHYIGDVDPIKFMHKFLPWNIDDSSAFKKFKTQKPSKKQLTALKSMATKSGESDMNRACHAALRGWPKAYRVLSRNIDFEDTHNHRDSFSGLGTDEAVYNRQKPWIPRKTMIKVDFANMLSFLELKPDHRRDAFIDSDRKPYPGPGPQDADWEKAGVVYDHERSDTAPDAADYSAEQAVDAPDTKAFVAEDDHGEHPANSPEDRVEVKVDSDPSPSARYPFENDTEGGRKTRGQIASYAGVIMAMQFRSHLFSVLICGKYARFIRWDRSCAIVSRRFDYTLYPNILFNFYHRFAQLTDTQRGLLPCFKTASDTEASAALEALAAYAGTAYGTIGGAKYKKRLNRKRIPLLHMDYKGGPYVVPAPTFNGGMFSPFGRDYWREHSEYTKTEAEVYDLLSTNSKTKECLYFAKMHAGGDAEVDGCPATTIGFDDTDMPWKTGKLLIRKLTAHFIILETIGRDLKMFRSARELVSSMADAMEAHQLAYDELHILHRDISAGNILISTDKPDRGILIDWDHCIFMDNLTEDRKTRVHRTGTWQFMSAHLTANPESACHGLVDDRESALHVLLYMGIRHLAHNKANAFEMRDLLNMFDDYIEVDGNPYRKGTMSKLNFMASGAQDLIFNVKPINRLIRALCGSFSTRYEQDSEDTEDDEDAEDQDLTISTLRAAQRQSRLENMKKPEWLYEVFRRYAVRLPMLSPGELDYIDNTKVLKPNRKRPLVDDLCDDADDSKLISTHDGIAGSIDAGIDLAPPVETPPRKKQRTGKK
ncbi:hypothetical protein PTI98_002076 [Pleurotus ostreatus]|nr:hypothetical protein PTI98_002076 [Pleurotus ostreatus]